MQFGGIGTVIGHELQHAFDDEGMLFDGDGDLDPGMFDPADAAAFSERTDCIEAIYGNFSVAGGIPVRAAPHSAHSTSASLCTLNARFRLSLC